MGFFYYSKHNYEFHENTFYHRNNPNQQEVAGYAEVMETVFHAWPDMPITENYIKRLHRDLLRYSDKDERHRGEYKKLPNSITAFDESGKQIGIVLVTTAPFDTPQLMQELIAWWQDMRKLGRWHPLLLIAIFIVIFLAIHPFQDDNGRLSRVLTTLMLLQAGYAYVSYSSLENVIEHNKEGYYLALRQTQGTIHSTKPNWQPWLEFFMRALQQQKRRLAIKIEHEQLMLTALPELAIQIIEHARHHGRVIMGEIMRVTGGNRNTLKEHFRLLVRRGMLKQHGVGKGTWYTLL